MLFFFRLLTSSGIGQDLHEGHGKFFTFLMQPGLEPETLQLSERSTDHRATAAPNY